MQAAQVRQPHAFCVNFTLAGPIQSWKCRINRVGMIPVKDYGLIMKLRGMISKFPLQSPGPIALVFFSVLASFFSFYLTRVGFFCNHHRPPVG
jgi:hypothetical protein